MLLKILSFNFDGLKEKSTKVSETLKLINSISPDIFGLQESDEQIIKNIQKKLNYNSFIGIGITEKESSSELFNPIFWNSEFELIRKNSFYLSKNFLLPKDIWDSNEPRSVSWVLLKNKRDLSRIIVINTHLDNSGIISRKESSIIISELGKELSKEFCCSVVLIGDFNSRPWFPADEKQELYGKYILPGFLPTDNIIDYYLKNDFKDSFHESGNTITLDSNTYHDYKGRLFPKVGLRIDWQLFLSYKNCLNINKYYLYKDVIISDHFPVICSYELQATIEDFLYSGKNKVFKMCSKGLALRRIADFLKNKFRDEKYLKKFILENNFLKLTRPDLDYYDVPSFNAVIQKELVQSTEIENKDYIIKKQNPLKNDSLKNEISVYCQLKSIFPKDYYLGNLKDKKVFFRINAPIYFDSKSYSFSIMTKLEGPSFDEIIYDCSDNALDLLEFYSKIIFIFLDNKFICADMSPRNVILEENETTLIFNIFDFEKSYFSKEAFNLEETVDFLRGQICGEELGVLFDLEDIKKVFKDLYNVDKWNLTSNQILLKPYRPEIDYILKGRNVYPYSLRLYNLTELEVLKALKPNKNLPFEYLRFPGRMKFKIEHYLSCFNRKDGIDYERKFTELLIKFYKSEFNSSFLKYFHSLISWLEEEILINYSINSNNSSLINKLIIKLCSDIDQLYFSEDFEKEFNKLKKCTIN